MLKRSLISLLILFLFVFAVWKVHGSIKASQLASSRSVIFTSEAPKPIGTYSQAVKTLHMVYISGQIGLSPDSMQLISNNFEAQLRQVLKNIAAVAKAAGGSLDDIVKMTIYVTDLNDFPLVNKIMNENFRQPYPARAVIGVNQLPKEAKVEIEAVMERDN